ncbi:hypothetical protein AMECASPLE_001896 [Ameca splendens]|uniref:Uncharacterized protein n=1 Tax=Ameca splendens TaxID=208324 RepID=A0ABV0ZU14_9TELE
MWTIKGVGLGCCNNFTGQKELIFLLVFGLRSDRLKINKLQSPATGQQSPLDVFSLRRSPLQRAAASFSFNEAAPRSGHDEVALCC